MSSWIPPKDHDPKLFVKFGHPEFMEAFLRRGLMRFGTLGGYAAMEDPLRGDPNEGVNYILQPDRVTSLTIDGEVLDPANLTGPITARPKYWGQFNVYCMYLIHPGSLPIDDENREFGNAAVLIKNGPAFLRRLTAAATAAAHSCRARHVEYVPPDYHGILGPFRKFEKYCRQSEWRFILMPGTGEEYFLEIGSLEDIAELVDLDYVNAKVEFRDVEEEVE